MSSKEDVELPHSTETNNFNWLILNFDLYVNINHRERSVNWGEIGITYYNASVNSAILSYLQCFKISISKSFFEKEKELLAEWWEYMTMIATYECLVLLGLLFSWLGLITKPTPATFPESMSITSFRTLQTVPIYCHVDLASDPKLMWWTHEAPDENELDPYYMTGSKHFLPQIFL